MALSNFILSAILYLNFEGIALKLIYNSTKSSLAQISQDTDVIITTANSLSYRIYCDLSISKLLYYDSPDVYDEGPAYTQLNNYRFSIPFIDSIYVYNASNLSNSIYISISSDQSSFQKVDKGAFFDQEILEILKKGTEEYKPLLPIPRGIKITTSQNEYVKNYYTFIYYDALLEKGSVKNAVVVNVSDVWLQKIGDVQTSSGGSDVCTFILDSKGTLISSNWKYPILSDLSDKSYVGKITGAGDEPGYFVWDVEGTKSLATYSAPNSFGWRFVRLTPYKDIIREIDAMKLKTITIGILFLVFGLVISFLVSRRIYRPINSIISTLDNLEAEKRNSFHTLRQDFLRNILMEKEPLSAGSLQQKFTRYDINLEIEKRFVLVLMRIDRYFDFLKRYNSEDRNLYKFAIMNIASEICSRRYANEAAETGEDSVVLLLSIPKEEDVIFDADFNSMLKEIQAGISKYSEVSVSLTVSLPGNTVDSIAQLYKQVKEASFHKLFLGHSCIIYSEEIMGFKDKIYIYPKEKENLLVEAIMLDRMQKAKSIYLEIIDDARDYPYTVINLALSSLIFTIRNISENIQRYATKTDGPVLDTFISLDGLETVDEMNARFFELFDAISVRMKDMRGSKHEHLVDKINETILSGYMKQDLSLDSIAASLKLSPSYIGRLYKQNTMTTILENIIKIRMEKAKELLSATELSIAEIAENTGFSSSSYFYKTFKRENGLTPNEYRSTHRLHTPII